MARKLGQIIAVRENTWMVHIPLGRDPQTQKRSYRSSHEDSIHQVLIRQFAIDVTLEQQWGFGSWGETFEAKVC